MIDSVISFENPFSNLFLLSQRKAEENKFAMVTESEVKELHRYEEGMRNKGKVGMQERKRKREAKNKSF